MSAIGDLVITLSAQTGAFSRGIRGAQADLMSLSGSAKRTGAEVAGFSARMQAIGGKLGGLKAAVAGIGTAIAANRAVSAIKDQMDQIDELSKASRRLGISAREFIGLQHAANLSGVAVDQLTTGMQKLLKLVSEASRGGSQADVFERLGLSVASLKAMPVNEMMQQIASAINRVDDAAEKAEIAMDLFGRSGGSMLSLFEGGAAGLQAAAAEVERLGLAVSDMDAKGIEAANDALTKMQERASVAARSMAVGLAPAIKEVADAITWLTGGGVDTPPIVQPKTMPVQDILQSLVDAGPNVGAKQLRSARNMIYESMQDLRLKLPEDKLEDVASAVRIAYDAIERLQLGTGNAADNMALLHVQLLRVRDALGITAAEAAKAQKVLDDQQASAAKAAAERAAALTEKREQAQQNILEAAQEALDTFGMTDPQRAAFEMKQLGGTPEEIQKVLDLYRQLHEMQEQAALAEAGEALRDRLATPVEAAMEKLREAENMFATGSIDAETRRRAVGEQFDALSPSTEIRKKLDELQTLYDAGKISQDGLFRATEAYLKLAQKPTKDEPVPGVAALEKGSADAYSAIVSAMQKSQQEKGLDAVEKNTADTAGLLGEIADIMREERDGGQPIPTA
ncbi:MAG: hypothetical protein KJZ87_19750 [Thermoguttaceae bacterium]|nr:hypothetical protein [Thermoguttaceae bacterium]